MKPMNFNFVGKLPILLAKKPFTTIRKATEEEIKEALTKLKIVEVDQ